MRVIGLTGGVASGKSTVSRIFTELGTTVIDGDAVYHDLISPGPHGPTPLAIAIEARFPGVLEANGVIARPKLAQRVFEDPRELAALGDITRPAIAAATMEKIAAEATSGTPWLIYDAPLLYESQIDEGLAGVIVVWVPRSIQQQRLMDRSGFDPSETRRRIDAQMDLDEKKARATWVIDNSGSIEGTQSQVQRLWADLEADPTK